METIQTGYYEIRGNPSPSKFSLKEAILNCEYAPIISEIKFASPSQSSIRPDIKPKKVAKEMELGGAVGISILTEPKHFGGQLSFISKVRDLVSIPILMKDIVLSPVQIDAASAVGADVLLLIQALFDRGYCDRSLEEMISYTHSCGLEALLETHTEEEFLSALRTDADIIGINNRDLKTLKVDLQVTERILEKHPSGNKIVISESGIGDVEDIRFLRRCGAQAFLVGTSIMKSKDIQRKVRELVRSL
ncbi:TPA: indole-3-glycerol-phosphate synthase [Candidatus Bathyarchaeota archaeon]|nr:indole-3-glycerol-phosphate synthase [Candidatus Bathyarchaeota archaeon]